jgi:hypothetical protein
MSPGWSFSGRAARTVRRHCAATLVVAAEGRSASAHVQVRSMAPTRARVPASGRPSAMSRWPYPSGSAFAFCCPGFAPAISGRRRIPCRGRPRCRAARGRGGRGACRAERPSSRGRRVCRRQVTRRAAASSGKPVAWHGFGPRGPPARRRVASTARPSVGVQRRAEPAALSLLDSGGARDARPRSCGRAPGVAVPSGLPCWSIMGLDTSTPGD